MRRRRKGEEEPAGDGTPEPEDRLRAIRRELRIEEELTAAKWRVVKCLEKLPDDDARRRVILATAVLLGIHVPGPEEPPR